MTNAIDAATLRTFGEAIVGASAGGDRLAHKTVAAIEGDLFALGWPSGQTLGTVPDIQHRFSLGRWSCRQAVTILQARGLLDVRRGPGGGVYVAEPSVVDVARAFVLFLVLSDARLRHLYEVRSIVWRAVLDALTRSAPIAPLEPVEGDPLVQLAAATGRNGLHFVAALLDEVMRLSQGPARTIIVGSGAWANRLIQAINAGEGASIAAMSMEMESRDAYLRSEQRVTFIAPLVALRPLDRHNNAGVLAARLLEDILGERSNGVSQPCTEWDISGHYGFSMPVVRQALRLLEDIGAVDIVRGRSGGMRRAVPQSGAMIRLLFPCLASRNVSEEDILEMVGALAMNAPSLAAERVRQGQLPDALAKCASPTAYISALDPLAAEHLLLELSGNPVLTILVRAFGLQSLFCPPMRGRLTPRSFVATRSLNIDIMKAIESAQPEEAARLAAEKDRTMRQLVQIGA